MFQAWGIPSPRSACVGPVGLGARGRTLGTRKPRKPEDLLAMKELIAEIIDEQ